MPARARRRRGWIGGGAPRGQQSGADIDRDRRSYRRRAGRADHRLGEISGGHFSPLISGLQWLAGERPLHCTLSYVAAQCVGGIAGALLAKELFHLGEAESALPVATWPMALSEVVASAGLMTVVFSCARSGRKEAGPFAVGAWLFAAVLATPSASFANPAIAIAAFFARGPIALSASQVLAYVPAEIAGALIALIPLSIAYPRGSTS